MISVNDADMIDLTLFYQIPFWVSRYIAGGVGVSFPTDQLFKSLIVTLLVPLIIGKVRPSFCVSYLLFLLLFGEIVKA